MIRDNIRIGIKDDLDGGIFKINMIKMITKVSQYIFF